VGTRIRYISDTGIRYISDTRIRFSPQYRRPEFRYIPDARIRYFSPHSTTRIQNHYFSSCDEKMCVCFCVCVPLRIVRLFFVCLCPKTNKMHRSLTWWDFNDCVRVCNECLSCVCVCVCGWVRGNSAYFFQLFFLFFLLTASVNTRLPLPPRCFFFSPFQPPF